MSQFDFPRINYVGQALINPSTGNNSFFQPIVYYDPIQTKALMPPRLYLQEKHLMPGKTLADLEALIPQEVDIETDGAGARYIRIQPIDNKKIFHEWATTPLGSHEIDRAYHPMYALLVAEKSKKPLAGTHPGYWNYHGDMTFSFKDVRVNSIELYDKKMGKRLLEENEALASVPYGDILGAELNMVDVLGKKWGVMIDVCPSMALYSQVFSDFLVLEKNGKQLFRGKPCKASLRFLNFSRIVNQFTIEAASGSFFCTISLDELEQGEESLIWQFFRQQLPRTTQIKGLFIRYNLLEVIENQTPDYRLHPGNSNPARATVVGSITPWFEGEARSITMGRQLLPVAKILGNCSLGSMVCKVDRKKGLLSLDAIGSIPEVLTASSDEALPSYQTFDLGNLRVQVEDKWGQRYLLAEIPINPRQYPRAEFLRCAGMIDISLKGLPESTIQQLRTGKLLVEGLSRSQRDSPGTTAVLLEESPLMVSSDQSGLYAEAGEDPKEGYRSYSYEKEPCFLRVYKKGRPVKKATSLEVIAYTITEAGWETRIVDLPGESIGKFRDMQPLLFPLEEAANVIYFFTQELSLTAIESMQVEIAKSGHFINLRVLPRQDYGKYLDPAHPEYPAVLDFQTLYKEVFELYDLVYPVSAVISPFTENALSRAAGILKHLMHPNNWSSPTYMPSTREMSSSQYALFEKWISGLMH